MAEDEPVDQITDLLRRINNLYLDVPHVKFRGDIMKKLRERILADGGLQYKEGVNAVYHMLRVPSVEYDQIEFDLCQDRHR